MEQEAPPAKTNYVGRDQIIYGDNVEGDKIEGDKVTYIFGLSGKQTLLLGAIAGGVILITLLLIRQIIISPPFPPVPNPLSGDFKIGVTAIGESNTAQEVVSSNDGREFSDELFTQLDSAIQSEALEIKIGLGEPERMGTITGKGHEYLEQARKRAEEMNADILIFGYLKPGEEWSWFQPALYINPKVFRTAEEAADYFELNSIRVADNFLTNPITASELRAQLISRTQEYLYLNLGVGYLARNEIDKANEFLDKAYHQAEIFTSTKDLATLLLLKGNVALRQKDYYAAYTYYSKAKNIDPGYARAMLGMGKALFNIVLHDSKCLSEKIDRSKLETVLQHYDDAEKSASISLAEIPSKAALFRAQTLACLAIADQNEADIVDAKTNYQRVIDNNVSNPSPLLQDLAAEASSGLALLVLGNHLEDLSQVPVPTLIEALDDFKKATNLTQRPNRRAQFLLGQVDLYLAQKDCQHANSSIDEALNAQKDYHERSPSTPDKELDESISKILDKLAAICKGGFP